eukprot:6147263-Ditylum_brightwellii.AAC.1
MKNSQGNGLFLAVAWQRSVSHIVSDAGSLFAACTYVQTNSAFSRSLGHLSAVHYLSIVSASAECCNVSNPCFFVPTNVMPTVPMLCR